MERGNAEETVKSMIDPVENARCEMTDDLVDLGHRSDSDL